MKAFFRHILSFSVTHLFFALFLLFGIKILIKLQPEEEAFLYEYTLALFVIATLVQSLLFTILGQFFKLSNISFIITALGVDILIANSLYFGYVNSVYVDDEWLASVVMNVCIVLSFFIMMLIREYSVQNS